MIPMNPQRKVSARELRRRLNAETTLTHGQLVPAVQQLLHNDVITQGKVTALEAWRAQWTTWSLWARLRWLLKGTI